MALFNALKLSLGTKVHLESKFVILIMQVKHIREVLRVKQNLDSCTKITNSPPYINEVCKLGEINCIENGIIAAQLLSLLI